MKMMMIVLLLLISQHASGVEVYEGAESVLLPCQIPADVSRSSTAAAWDRDEFKKSTVHLRLKKSDNLDERDDLSGQNELYQHRTSMRVDALQTGDLSLTLRNPTASDSGNYTCTSRRAGEDQSKTVVQLKVSEPPPVWPKVLSAVLVILILLAAPFGLFVCCASKRMKDSEALLPEVLEVPQGEKSVLLPFETTADLPQDVRVEWTRLDSNKTVHVYERGNNQPDKQHQGYRGRTEMEKDPLRTKDLSLTLKHLHLTDSAVYTCTVYEDGKMLTQKSVTLCVKVPQPEVVNVTDADESVLLPFKTTADLRQDVTVEWTLTEPTERKVHVYESENNQSHNQDQDYKDRTEMKDKDPLGTGDFSLTLQKPRLTDSKVYTCTVYDKDGHMLLQKSVILRVRENVPDIVQVAKAKKSVQLPFKTTADLPQDVTVEWTDSNDKMVHVYESGNNQPDKQHQGRTEMNKDPLRTGDLSLKLDNPRLTDSGVYTCTVKEKNGDKLLQKSVTLSVYDTLRSFGTAYGDKSYLLEFKKPDKPDQISKVEWKRIYPKYKDIKEIERDQENDKDFSLNLEDLRLTDSGIYTCTSYDKGGAIMLRQSVIFSVRDFQVEVVEVTEGEESVLLPFETTADLHHVVSVYWTVFESTEKMVHYLDVNKSNQPGLQYKPYRGRTAMKKDPLRTGDLSLTLKKPLLTDSYSYTCTVCNKDGRVLVQKVVTLRVRASLKGTMVGMLTRRKKERNAEDKEDVRNRNHEQQPLTAEERV